ncbi:MAG: CbiX/SirB N-terminal domain-containing protein [Nitrososphaerales archaeon]
MEKIGYIFPAHGSFPFDFIRKNARVFSAVEDFVGNMYQMLREWPRTPENDPFLYENLEWAKKIKAKGSYKEVGVGFWSFTPPHLTEACRKMGEKGVDRIICLASGLQSAGHTIHEVPKMLERTKKSMPGVEIVYLPPPYDYAELVNLFQKHLAKARDPMRW